MRRKLSSAARLRATFALVDFSGLNPRYALYHVFFHAGRRAAVLLLRVMHILRKARFNETDRAEAK